MGAKKPRRLTPSQRREIIRLRAQGLSSIQIAQRLGLGSRSIRAVLRPLGGVIRKEMWQAPSGRKLSLDERIQIKVSLEQGMSLNRIARQLQRAVSTVSREVKANGGPQSYWPSKAQKLADERARRPKPTKLASNPELLAYVTGHLEKLWSPEQISARLTEDFPDDPTMRISPETIYKSLYVQGRGELRRELRRCLRSGRTTRAKRNRMETRGKIPDMVNISERPPEVEDRAVPGHWEGDLLIGAGGKGAIGTLVERASRYVLLFGLPNGRSAPEVRDAMKQTIMTLPESLRRTLTWDQGKEMADHVRFALDTDIAVFFCDPHSPWQRGLNENTNGLLRQYFPKTMDLSKVTDEQLRAAADGLNTRPRQTLGWKTPAEALAGFVAMTA